MLLVLSLAFADVAPPPDFVETCTVEAACNGQEATSCSASFSGREACAALEGQGWVKACQTRGASVWTEVLCKPGTGSAGTPKPVTTGGKGCGSQSAGGALVLGALALWRKRRGAR